MYITKEGETIEINTTHHRYILCLGGVQFLWIYCELYMDEGVRDGIEKRRKLMKGLILRHMLPRYDYIAWRESVCVYVTFHSHLICLRVTQFVVQGAFPPHA